jgi:hypothetical protein
VEGLIWLSLITVAIVFGNNIKLRRELKKKIDFEYEQYELWRKTK